MEVKYVSSIVLNQSKEAKHIASHIDILLDLYRKQFKNKIKRDYEPKPSTPGLIIGGKSIAALAMAAGKTSEAYSMAAESLRYAAENKRSELSSSPQTISISKNNDGKNQNSYGKYGQAYEKYQQALEYLRQKASRVYTEIIDAVKKARQGIYSQHPKNPTRQPYNPFRKLGLTGKVVELSKHLKDRTNYPIIRRRDYASTISGAYNRNQGIGGLEEKLAA